MSGSVACLVRGETVLTLVNGDEQSHIMISRFITLAVPDVRYRSGILALLNVTQSGFTKTFRATAGTKALEYLMTTSAEPIRGFRPFLSVIMAIAVLPYEL